MEDKFSAQGFTVLGFTSDDFAMQGGNDAQIDACNSMYAVSFQEFDKDHVTGPSAQPVWAWMEAQPNPGPSATATPNWNFNKYLISREGKLIAHWIDTVYPGDDPANPNDSFDTSPIVVAIKAELAKP